MTLDEFIARLRSGDPRYKTPEGLLILVDQLSIKTNADGPNATTVVYSGALTPTRDGASTSALADYLARTYPDTLRIINNTDRAKGLDLPEFLELAEADFGGDGVAMRSWLYEPTTGPWALLSSEF